VQLPSNVAIYKHSEFQQYNGSPNLGAQGGQAGIQGAQKGKTIAQSFAQTPALVVQPPQQPLPFQPPPNSVQRENNKITTFGLGSVGPSTAANIHPLVQVQHNRSQSPVRTSGVGVPQPIFYSPPLSQSPPALQINTLNERTMGLAQVNANHLNTTAQGASTVRRSNVYEPTGSGYNILPHELPYSNKSIRGVH